MWLPRRAPFSQKDHVNTQPKYRFPWACKIALLINQCWISIWTSYYAVIIVIVFLLNCVQNCIKTISEWSVGLQVPQWAHTLYFNQSLLFGRDVCYKLERTVSIQRYRFHPSHSVIGLSKLWDGASWGVWLVSWPVVKLNKWRHLAPSSLASSCIC